MSERYFDKFEIRNKVEVNIGIYTAYSYEDKFMNKWVGNINVYIGEKCAFHATTKKALTEEELKHYLEVYIARKGI